MLCYMSLCVCHTAKIIADWNYDREGHTYNVGHNTFLCYYITTYEVGQLNFFTRIMTGMLSYNQKISKLLMNSPTYIPQMKDTVFP